jgi:hypothetical protein
VLRSGPAHDEPAAEFPDALRHTSNFFPFSV